MAARMIVAASDPQSGEGEISALSMQGTGSMPSSLLSANPVGGVLSRLEDSETLLDELLWRFETANPLPWRHGGLNE